MSCDFIPWPSQAWPWYLLTWLRWTVAADKAYRVSLRYPWGFLMRRTSFEFRVQSNQIHVLISPATCQDVGLMAIAGGEIESLQARAMAQPYDVVEFFCGSAGAGVKPARTNLCK